MTPEQLSTAIVDVADDARRPRARSPCPTACRRQVTVERPRQKGHGDYATNVALQLAKKAGTNPRAFAELVAARLERAPTASPSVEIAGPGFLNITRRGRRPGRRSPREIVAAAASVRRHRRVRRARRSTSSSSRPTRPARSTSAASAGRRSATRSAGSSAMTGAEVTREYYFNDHGAQIDRFSRSLLASAQGRAGARGRLRRRVHRRDRRRRRRQARPTSSDLPDDGGAGGLPRRRRRPDVRGDQAEPARLRGRLRRLLPRGQPAQERRRRARRSTRLTELGNTYEQDGALWLRTEKFGDDKDRVIIKSDGQRGLPLRRPRLLPRQAGARLRPLLHHARRRPPRLRRPDDGDVRRVRRRAAQEPRDPDRPDGQPAPRRRSRCGCPSGPARSSPSTTWSRRSASTPAATPWRATSRLHHRHRPRPVGQGQQRQPGLLRAVRPRPHLLDPAQRRRPRPRAVADDVRPRPARRTRRRASCCARSPSSRGWSPRRPSCASRTGSRATSRTPPASYHRFYDTCRVLPHGRRGADRPAPRPADAGRRRPAPCSPTASRLLGVSAPERM